MKQEKSCGCIVMNEKNEILLVHHNAGHWGIPKGHMEEGETEVENAIREVKEETNVDVVVDTNYRYVMEYSPKEDVMKEVVLFLARNVNNNQEPQLKEVSEVQWFNFDNAIETITYDNAKQVLKKLKQDLEEAKKC